MYITQYMLYINTYLKLQKKIKKGKAFFYTCLYIYIMYILNVCRCICYISFLKPFLKKKENKIYQEEKKIELC